MIAERVSCRAIPAIQFGLGRAAALVLARFSVRARTIEPAGGGVNQSRAPVTVPCQIDTVSDVSGRELIGARPRIFW